MTGEEVPAAAVRVAFGDNADRACRYAELLATLGVERGLIGPRETDRIWGRHMFNCAALAQLVPSSAAVIDLGSGAGLPGIPVALALPDVSMTLLEPMARRVEFLTECLVELDLPNVTVRRARAQDKVDVTADVVVARAVAALPELVELARPLTASSGRLLALKGAKAAAEIDALPTDTGARAVLHTLADAQGEPATVVEVRWSGPAVREPRKRSVGTQRRRVP